MRVLTNPTAKQSDYGAGQLVNFHIGFLNSIPLMELIIGAVVIVGAYVLRFVGRKKAFAPVAPPDEDLTGIAPATST